MNFNLAGFLTATASAVEQLYELIDGHTGVSDDAAEGARSDLLVVGYDNPSMRFVAAKDHVTATLAAEHEACPFQGGPYFSAGRSIGSLATNNALAITRPRLRRIPCRPQLGLDRQRRGNPRRKPQLPPRYLATVPCGCCPD